MFDNFMDRVEVLELKIVNEEELYEEIASKLKEGMSANSVVSQLKDSLNSLEDIDTRDFAEISLTSGAVFGKQEAVFYFDMDERDRGGELLTVFVVFDYMELI